MTPPSFSRPAHTIDSVAALDTLLSHLRAVKRIALDTEADTFYRYRPQLCLVQVTAEGEDYIVDPLAVGDPRPLRDLFTLPGVEKVFHGAENDLTLIYRTLGVRVEGPLFDTYIAAQVAGEKRVGFGALVEGWLGVTLDKSFQLHDWGRRPLEADALAYARGDTHFLLAIADRVWEGVTARRREDHAREEFGRLADKVEAQSPFDPDGCLKLKGARTLDPIGLKVLRALYVFREAEAERANLAPFRVLQNDALIAIARARPTNISGLAKVPSLRETTLRRIGHGALEAVARGQAPDAPMPQWPAPEGRPDPVVEGRVKRLRKWRERAATELGIDPGFLAPNHLLQTLATHRPQSVEALASLPVVRRWQIAEFGEVWISLLSQRP